VAGLLDAVDGDGLEPDGEGDADELLLGGDAAEPEAAEEAAVALLAAPEQPASNDVASARTATRPPTVSATCRGYGVAGVATGVPPGSGAAGTDPS
jgi:hypothetical protein